jgi:hypothetical protein
VKSEFVNLKMGTSMKIFTAQKSSDLFKLSCTNSGSISSETDVSYVIAKHWKSHNGLTTSQTYIFVFHGKYIVLTLYIRLAALCAIAMAHSVAKRMQRVKS